jgi:hypothetical protein
LAVKTNAGADELVDGSSPTVLAGFGPSLV